MRTLAIALLAIVGLFTGGCSLYFIVFLGSDSFSLSLPGLFIAAICGLLLKAMQAK